MKHLFNLRIRIFTIIAFLTGWILIAGVAPQATIAKEVNPHPYKIGGDFTLIGHHGTKVHLKDYRGKVVLMTFGFTNCPDVCPLILSNLKRVVKKLGDHANQVQTLFITVDPARDTEELLKKYVTYFNPTFMGLTGSQEEITAIAKQYGAIFIKQEVESAAGYFFAHTDYVYLIDQQGKVREIYRPDIPVGDRVKHIQQLLAAKQS